MNGLNISLSQKNKDGYPELIGYFFKMCQIIEII